MSVDDYKKDHSHIQDLQMEQHMSKKPRRNHAPAFKAKVAVPRYYTPPQNLDGAIRCMLIC
jgi:hypothetical protein